MVNLSSELGIRVIRRAFSVAIMFVLCVSVAVNGQDFEIDHFMAIDSDSVAFPDVKALSESPKPISTRREEWSFSVSQETDGQVLVAETGDTRITQSITPDAVFKRFAFDMRRQRFEPLRQEIRIDHTSEKTLREIEGLTGVTTVKRYENLGFSIVKIKAEVNPVEVFRTLKSDFESVHARILTGFFDDEPM